MALAIALAIGDQQSRTATVKEDEPTTVWTRDMWEDYRAADKETKEYLLRKWGRPKR